MNLRITKVRFRWMGVALLLSIVLLLSVFVFDFEKAPSCSLKYDPVLPPSVPHGTI